VQIAARPGGSGVVFGVALPRARRRTDAGRHQEALKSQENFQDDDPERDLPVDQDEVEGSGRSSKRRPAGGPFATDAEAAGAVVPCVNADYIATAL
jgi:hypothetical protein